MTHQQIAALLLGGCVGGVVGGVLTVAHLDHNPANCDPANLRAWCQPHHLRYDTRHHARNAANTRRQRQIEAGQDLLWQEKRN